MAKVSVKKAFNFVANVVAFAKSPQGKRDVALVVAAVGAVADFLKQVGVV